MEDNSFNNNYDFLMEASPSQNNSNQNTPNPKKFTDYLVQSDDKLMHHKPDSGLKVQSMNKSPVIRSNTNYMKKSVVEEMEDEDDEDSNSKSKTPLKDSKDHD